MNKMIFAAVLASCFLAAPVRADNDGDIDRRVRVLLYRHHGLPTAEEFERLVPGAKTRLLVLANDARTDFVLRDRALVALAGYGGEEVRAVYDRVLADPSVKVATQAKVLAAYARIYPREVSKPVLEKARRSKQRALRSVAELNLRDPNGTAPRTR